MRNFLVLHVDLVLRHVLNEEALLLDVPEDLRVLLRQGGLLSKEEVSSVCELFFFAPNVEPYFAGLLPRVHVVLAAVLSDELRVRWRLVIV